MAPLTHLIVLAVTAAAHFTLNYPLTSGFDDDLEGTGPCGSFTPDFTKTTDFHVDGDNVAMSLFHPQANWLFRGTLDVTGKSNWSQLFPIVQQTGQTSFCEPNITVPSSWAGQKGVLGVVCDGPDGLLYQVRFPSSLPCEPYWGTTLSSANFPSQCAAVNFVNGTGTLQPNCTNGTNGTSVQATFTSDATLTADVGVSGSPSASKGAGLVGTTNWALLASGLVTPLIMAAFGAALMI